MTTTPDRLARMQTFASSATKYRPWSSVHENGSCGDTAPKGGSGRIHGFAVS